MKRKHFGPSVTARVYTAGIKQMCQSADKRRWLAAAAARWAEPRRSNGVEASFHQPAEASETPMPRGSRSNPLNMLAVLTQQSAIRGNGKCVVSAGEMCSRAIGTLDLFSEEGSTGDQLSRLLAPMIIILSLSLSLSPKAEALVRPSDVSENDGVKFPLKTWFNPD